MNGANEYVMGMNQKIKKPKRPLGMSEKRDVLPFTLSMGTGPFAKLVHGEITWTALMNEGERGLEEVISVAARKLYRAMTDSNKAES